MKGLTEQCPERPLGDSAISWSDPGRRGKRKRTGNEKGRDQPSHEWSDKRNEKASGGDGRFATFRSVTYVPLFLHLANRAIRKTKSRRRYTQHVPSLSRLINTLYDDRRINLTTTCGQSAGSAWIAGDSKSLAIAHVRKPLDFFYPFRRMLVHVH